jgi:hypothetical protein
LSKLAKYETEFKRVILAILIGSVLGGFISVLPFAAASSPTDIDSLFFIVMYASTKWFWGILIFGLPAWFLLHITGWREWYIATLAGAVLPVFRLMILASVFSQTRSLADIIKSAIIFSPVGIIVALVVWLIAYRRIERSDMLNSADKP